MNTRMCTRHALTLVACIGASTVASLVGGCNTLAASHFSGRVLPGAAPIVRPVDDNDSRLKTAGIEGVEVEITSIGRAGDSHLIGTATTDKDGQFLVEIDDRTLLKNQMILTARRGGVPVVREPVLLPGEGRQVLVLMPEIGKPKGN